MWLRWQLSVLAAACCSAGPASSPESPREITLVRGPLSNESSRGNKFLATASFTEIPLSPPLPPSSSPSSPSPLASRFSLSSSKLDELTKAAEVSDDLDLFCSPFTSQDKLDSRVGRKTKFCPSNHFVTASDAVDAVQNISLCFVRLVRKMAYKHRVLPAALDILRYAIHGSQVFEHDHADDVQGSLEILESFLCGSNAFKALLPESEIHLFFNCVASNSEAWRYNYSRDQARLIGNAIEKRLSWFRRQPAYKARRAIRLIANDEYIKRKSRTTMSAAGFLYYVFEHSKDDGPSHELTVNELDDAYVDEIMRERTFTLGQTILLMRAFIEKIDDAMAMVEKDEVTEEKGEGKEAEKGTEGDESSKASGSNDEEDVQKLFEKAVNPNEDLPYDLHGLLNTLRLNLKEKNEKQVMKAFSLTAESSADNFSGDLLAFFQSADIAYMTACAGEVFLRSPKIRAVFIELIESLILEGAKSFTEKRRLALMRTTLEYAPKLILRMDPVNPYAVFVSMLGPAIIDNQSPPMASLIARFLSEILPYIDTTAEGKEDPLIRSLRAKAYGLMMKEFFTLLGFGEDADIASTLMRYVPVPQKHTLPAGSVRALLDEHSDRYAHLIGFCGGNEWDLAEYLSLSYEILKAIPNDAYHAEIEALAEVFEDFTLMDPETLGELLMKLAASTEAEMQVTLTLRLAKFQARFTDWLWFGQITAEDEVRRLAASIDSLHLYDRQHQ